MGAEKRKDTQKKKKAAHINRLDIKAKAAVFLSMNNVFAYTQIENI